MDPAGDEAPFERREPQGVRINSLPEASANIDKVWRRSCTVPRPFRGALTLSCTWAPFRTGSERIDAVRDPPSFLTGAACRSTKSRSRATRGDQELPNRRWSWKGARISRGSAKQYVEFRSNLEHELHCVECPPTNSIADEASIRSDSRRYQSTEEKLLGAVGVRQPPASPEGTRNGDCTTLCRSGVGPSSQSKRQGVGGQCTWRNDGGESGVIMGQDFFFVTPSQSGSGVPLDSILHPLRGVLVLARLLCGPFHWVGSPSFAETTRQQRTMDSQWRR